MPDQSANPDISRDITVLVPAYQCASQLADHSKTLQRYRKLGCSVLWVVSPSPDGSEKLAQTICQETGDAFLLSPPGLYESWNFGITRVSTEFLAVSTIGDFYLNDNLLAMAKLLKELSADVCFTPPSFEGLSENQIRGFSFRQDLSDATVDCRPGERGSFLFARLLGVQPCPHCCDETKALPSQFRTLRRHGLVLSANAGSSRGLPQRSGLVVSFSSPTFQPKSKPKIGGAPFSAAAD